MTINKLDLYKEIAKNKNIRIDIVKKVFGEAENIIFQNFCFIFIFNIYLNHYFFMFYFLCLIFFLNSF